MTILPLLLIFAVVFGGIIGVMIHQAHQSRANLRAIAGRWNLVLTEKKTLGLTTATEL